MIKLDDNWEIHADENNFELRYNTGKLNSKGQPVYAVNYTRYHRTVKECVERYFKMKIVGLINDKEVDLLGFMEKINELNSQVSVLLNKIEKMETLL